jgi:hypothetical protein
LVVFSDAARVGVASHWRIPELHGNEGSVRDWIRIKRDVLVLDVKKSIRFRPNSLERLHRAVDRERVRRGVRLLLRAAAQGLRESAHDMLDVVVARVFLAASGRGPSSAPRSANTATKRRPIAAQQNLLLPCRRPRHPSARR